MGSLDEAKRQQYQRQIMAQAAESRGDQLNLIYRERILPKMAFIYSGLGNLCQRLNSTDQPIIANYFIEGLGRLDNLVQSDYQVSADNLLEINQIKLKYRCLSEGELNVYVEGKKNVDMYIDLLKENKLKFKGKIVKDDTDFVTGAKFFITRYVPVSFIFSVDAQNGSINLCIKNYDSLGEANAQFSAESITEDFLKNLAEYIARKNKGFFSLDLPELERRRIRAKVLYEQQQRAAELEAADKQATEIEMRKKGFFARLIGR